MNNTNYICGIVKILESPKKKFSNYDISITKFKVQLPKTSSSQIINLTFWGNLANDVADYYKVNDYIIIEGYLSLQNLNRINKTKKVNVTVLKVYPFLLSYNHSITQI